MLDNEETILKTRTETLYFTGEGKVKEVSVHRTHYIKRERVTAS